MDNRILIQPEGEGGEDEAINRTQRNRDWSVVSSFRRLFEPSLSDVRISVSSSPSRLPSTPSMRLLLSRNTSAQTTLSPIPSSPRVLNRGVLQPASLDDTIPLPTTSNIHFDTLPTTTTTTTTTTTSPLLDDTTTLASEAERHRLTTTTTTTSINLRSLVESIYRALPFIALLLLVFTLQHLTHTMFIILGTIILKGASTCFGEILASSRAVAAHTDMSLHSLASLPSVRKLILTAAPLPFFFYFDPSFIGEQLIRSATFRYPTIITEDGKIFSFADTLFAVVAADVFVRLTLVPISLVAFKLVGFKHHMKMNSLHGSNNNNNNNNNNNGSNPTPSTPFSSSSTSSSSSSKMLLRERTTAMNLITSTGAMYRSLIPIPSWWRYFCGGTREMFIPLLGYTAGILYLALKAVHSYKRILILRQEFMQVKTSPLNELERLGEQEVQQILQQQQNHYDHESGGVVGNGGNTTTTATAATTSGGNSMNDGMCSICHDTLTNPIRIASCQHIFCSECIDEWLERESTCPLCRGPVNHPGKVRFRTTDLLPMMY